MTKFVVGIAIGYFFGRPAKEGSKFDEAITNGARRAGHKIGEFIQKKVLG